MDPQPSAASLLAQVPAPADGQLDVLVLAAGRATEADFDAPAVRAVFDAALADERLHGPVLGALARAVPAVVLAAGPAWFTHADCDALWGLPEAVRFHLASALAPWPEVVVAQVAEQCGRLGWPPQQCDSMRAILGGTSDSPYRPHPLPSALVRPARRWRAVAEAEWDHTVWLADDGALVIEVVMDGVAVWSRTRILDAAQRRLLDLPAAARRAGLAALAEDIRMARVPASD